MRSVAFLSVLVLAVVPLASQPVPQAPAEKATLEGQVVKMGTAEPLRKAFLTLRKAQGRGQVYYALTDSGGRFFMIDIEPGRYRLRVERNGYVTQQYGQRNGSGPGTILSLEPGQRVRDVVVKMIPAGAITGRVYDEDGEPTPGVRVRALRYRYVRGQRQMSSARSATSNDLGEFRLFGLPPGRYYISATYTPRWARVADRTSIRIAQGQLELNAVLQNLEATIGGGVSPAAAQLGRERYAPTFYPGTSDPTTAVPIPLRAGDEMSRMDFTLVPATTVNITGQVFSPADASSGRRRRARVILSPRESVMRGAGSRSTARVDTQGKFEIRGVMPGSYILSGSLNASGTRYAARLPLEVGGSDIEGVTLNLTPGLTLNGRLRVEGAPLSTLTANASGNQSGRSRLRVFLRSRDGNSARTVTLKEDGRFEMKNVLPDVYSVGVTGAPDDYYVKSASMGGMDLLERGLDTSAGLPSGSLEVVLSAAGGRLEGVVVNEEQQAFGGVTVVLVPEQRRRHRQDLYKTATTDQNGRFSLRGIPPGDYELYAWESVEPGAYQDPEFLRVYEDRGESIRIEAARHFTVQLQAIAAEERPYSY